MYRILTLLAAFAVVGSVHPSVAQEETPSGEGQLSGRIVDAESGDPLPKATVSLWDVAGNDSTLVNGTVTDEDGRFSIEDVPIDSYLLRVRFVGYTTRRFPNTTPTEQAENASLGTIRLARKTTEVAEIQVMADRPAARMETDRNVYNTSEQTLSAGGSARTVLENLPSIRIDLDGSISYRGNESVSLHINGEPASLSGKSLISYLESLSAETVQRVEVIPNPSARYEPEGMAGIINIVLRHDLDAGWNGGLTLGTERDANDRYGGSGSANLGYQSGGWRLVGTYSHRRDSEQDSDSRLVEQFNENSPSSWVEQSAFQEEQDRSHSFNSQIDYNFSESTSLGFEGSFSLRGDEESGETEYWEFTGNASPSTVNRENLTLQDHYMRVQDNTSEDKSFDGRFDFNHDFSEDHTLSLQARYDRDLESQDGAYHVYGFENGTRLDTPRDQEFETTNEDEQDGSFEIDYERPLGAFSMEAGYRGTLRRLDSDRTFEGDETLFTFDEIIHAGYGILSRSLGDFELEAGLRAETVNTTFDLSSENEITNSSYVSFYPSAFLTYQPNHRRQARLSYSKRVDRPSLWDLNPIDDNEDPTFREEGNPGLDPEYIHSFEFTATQRWNFASLTITPYVRHTVNEIEEVTREQTTESGQTVIVRRAENLSSSTSYGTELVATFNVGDRFEGTLNGNLYRSVTDGSNLTTDRSQDAILFSSRASVQTRLRDGLQLELSQFYRPARDIPPQGRMDRFMNTELGLRQELFGGDGSLTLRVDDLFNDTQMNMWYRDQDIYQQSTSQWGAREVSLSFQYTFGSGSNEDQDRDDYDDYR